MLSTSRTVPYKRADHPPRCGSSMRPPHVQRASTSGTKPEVAGSVRCRKAQHQAAPPGGLSSNVAVPPHGSRPAGPPAPGPAPSPNGTPSIPGRTARNTVVRSDSGTPDRCRRPRSPLRRVSSPPSWTRVAPPCLTALAIALSTASRSPAGSPMMMHVGDGMGSPEIRVDPHGVMGSPVQ